MVPIAGWKSNVEVSADADTRVWAARATGTPANAADGAPVIFPTVSFDTHGAYDENTGEYITPANGYLEVSGYFSLSGTSPLFAVYVDGVQGEDCGNTTVTGNCVIATGPVKVKAGQKVTIRPHGAAANGFVSGGYISFRRCSGASQITASESVFASAYVSSNYTVNANEAVNFDIVIEDSHNCITPGAADAWEYVFPLSGSYMISLIGAVTGTDSVPELELDGSAVCSLVTLKQSGSPVGSGSALIRAKQGQILQINSSASTTFVGSGAPYQSMISISRVGN